MFNILLKLDLIGGNHISQEPYDMIGWDIMLKYSQINELTYTNKWIDSIKAFDNEYKRYMGN